MQTIQWRVEPNYLTVPPSYKIRFVPRGSIGTEDLAIAMNEENPNYSVEDAKTMLTQDLWGEDNAITRYKERIRQAEEMQEYGLRRVLEDILIQEEEHKRDLQDALG